MSASALRAVRELRGDDSRPGTSAGVRPGTSSGGRAVTPVDHPDTILANAAHAREIEEVRLALEKERRSNRALEGYLTELGASKDAEMKDLALELRQTQTSQQRLEADFEKMEGMYKTQITKMVSQLEKIQTMTSPSVRDVEESFSTVLREEMRTMQQSFTLKLEKLQNELNSKTNDYTKQIRQLNETLVEERKKSNILMDKLARNNSTPVPASPSSSTTPSSAAAASASTKTHTTTTTNTTKPIVKK